MTDERRETKPAAVPFVAKQAGEIRARWAWTETCVWTARMLTALENGVKGGVWFSLIDKVSAPAALAAAWQRVRANHGAAGADHQTIAEYERHLAVNLENLSQELRAGTYRPQVVRRVWIPKPGSRTERPLGIPTVRDRVAQTALRQALEPIFERDFAEHSYGFRPGRGCKDALRRVEQLLQAGHHWVVEADLKSYFDTIPHEKLMARVKVKVADGRVLKLVEAYLQQKVLDGMEEWTPEGGTPQGAVISPLLSNIYLDPLDQLMARQGYEMVRYADDFIILSRSQEEAERALAEVRNWTAEAGLALHPEKTRIVDATQKGGFDFLGYHFERDYKWPAQKSLWKFKETIRALTKRTNGQSLPVLITRLNERLRGWFGYFKHSHKFTFKRLDGWIRRRLRSILRRRRGAYGLAKGRDQRLYPNRYFAGLGLYSLEQAHVKASQPLKR